MHSNFFTDDAYHDTWTNLGGTRDVMVIIVGDGHSDPRSNQDVNTLGKGINPTILYLDWAL